VAQEAGLPRNRPGLPDKDYLRAAKLCEEQIAVNKLHELELLRMKATLLLKSGEPENPRRV
jgi:hypothetical protein